jgi:hypothetical protein
MRDRLRARPSFAGRSDDELGVGAMPRTTVSLESRRNVDGDAPLSLAERRRMSAIGPRRDARFDAEDPPTPVRCAEQLLDPHALRAAHGHAG